MKIQIFYFYTKNKLNVILLLIYYIFHVLMQAKQNYIIIKVK